MTRPLAAFGLLLLLAACTSTTTVATGGLSEPVAMAVAETSAGPLVFVANATGDDLRAFDVQKQLFIRGPNAISPLSIDVGFRPTRLAAGIAQDSAGASHAFIAVAGAAPRLALVDAEHQTVVAAGTAPCTAGVVTASCLPAPAVDLASAGAELVAVLAPATVGGTPSLVLFHTGWTTEPTLSFDRTLALTGDLGGIAALSDGSKVYVADRSAPRVVEIDPASGVERDLTASGPVARVVLSPAYTAANTVHPEGEILLAILTDGTLQALDVASGAPVPDPFDPTLPAVPLAFGSPVRDVAFVPCASAACTTNLQLSTTDTEAEAALAFAALGDGTAVAIEPDPARPKLVVPVNPRHSGVASLITAPSASEATFTDPAHPEKTGTMALAASAITVAMGFTKSESWTVTDQGTVPGFLHRPATLAAGGGTLVDDQADPFTGADVRVGDTVSLGPLGTTCAALKEGATAKVAAIAGDTLTLGNLSPSLSACPMTRVLYSVRVPAKTWTVTGSASGYSGRATTGSRFADEGAELRFFYPPASVSTTAPAAKVRVGFTIPLTAPDDEDATFSFATSSGFGPFAVGSAGLALTAGGLANAVAATLDRAQGKDLLYLAQVGSNSLVQVDLALVEEATGTVIFQ